MEWGRHPRGPNWAPGQARDQRAAGAARWPGARGDGYRLALTCLPRGGAPSASGRAQGWRGAAGAPAGGRAGLVADYRVLARPFA